MRSIPAVLGPATAVAILATTGPAAEPGLIVPLGPTLLVVLVPMDDTEVLEAMVAREIGRGIPALNSVRSSELMEVIVAGRPCALPAMLPAFPEYAIPCTLLSSAVLRSSR